jgi:hypothetical protein
MNHPILNISEGGDGEKKSQQYQDVREEEQGKHDINRGDGGGGSGIGTAITVKAYSLRSGAVPFPPMAIQHWCVAVVIPKTSRLQFCLLKFNIVHNFILEVDVGP